MTINAHAGNPIIATQEQYYKLEELLHEIEPDCIVQLRPERLIIENIRRRTFRYTKSHYPVGSGKTSIYGRKWALNG